jgi:hypothetical protein
MAFHCRMDGSKNLVLTTSGSLLPRVLRVSDGLQEGIACLPPNGNIY